MRQVKCFIVTNSNKLFDNALLHYVIDHLRICLILASLDQV